MLNKLSSTRVQLMIRVAAWSRTTLAWYHAGDHAEFLVPDSDSFRIPLINCLVLSPIDTYLEISPLVERNLFFTLGKTDSD